MRLLRFFLPSRDYRIFTYDQNLVQNAAQRYGIDVRDLEPVRHLTAYVFRNPGKSFLKLTSNSSNSFERITQVNQWQNYLSALTGSVVSTIPSSAGDDAEKLNVPEGYFTSVLYCKAPGGNITQEEWGPDMFRKIGQLTGVLHRLTREYPHALTSDQVLEWHTYTRAEILTHVPRHNKDILQRYHSLLDQVSNYSRSGNTHGIIHSDIHKGNLLHHNGKLTLIDFDETCRSWFANDIAGIFLSEFLLLKKSLAEALEPFQLFQRNFWEGYLSENNLPLPEINTIPVWIALRAIHNYAHQISIGEHRNFNPTLRAYYLLVKKFANEPLELLSPGTFCNIKSTDSRIRENAFS